MIARRTRSMLSFTAAWARPTTVVFSSPCLATSTSTSQRMASMPSRMKEWMREHGGSVTWRSTASDETFGGYDASGAPRSSRRLAIWPAEGPHGGDITRSQKCIVCAAERTLREAEIGRKSVGSAEEPPRKPLETRGHRSLFCGPFPRRGADGVRPVISDCRT